MSETKINSVSSVEKQNLHAFLALRGQEMHVDEIYDKWNKNKFYSSQVEFWSDSTSEISEVSNKKITDQSVFDKLLLVLGCHDEDDVRILIMKEQVKKAKCKYLNEAEIFVKKQTFSQIEVDVAKTKQAVLKLYEDFILSYTKNFPACLKYLIENLTIVDFLSIYFEIKKEALYEYKAREIEKDSLRIFVENYLFNTKFLNILSKELALSIILDNNYTVPLDEGLHDFLIKNKISYGLFVVKENDVLEIDENQSLSVDLAKAILL